MLEERMNNTGFYLVREEWPDQPFDPVTHHDYIFVPPLKIFKKHTGQESKKEAEFYYAKRLKEIRVRKLMFPAMDKKQFTLTLAYADAEADICNKEVVIKVANEKNLPFDEDFKNGLFRVLPREPEK
jgi:hypothetical protein